jgi:hypothetical protein
MKHISKFLPLLCVFVFDAFAQCARVENNLYYYPDNTVPTDQTQVECVVLDKPDYFAQVSAGNDFFAAQPSRNDGGPDVLAIHAALLSRYSSLCEAIMAKQCVALLNIRCCMLIAYVKTPLFGSPEDVPFIAV